MVEILFDYRKSVRDRNWNLHFAASERMLKWFCACDRSNYARRFTFYWASQLNLSQSHLNILKKFQKGNFSVRKVPDQFIQQTVKQDQKAPGGIIGFSTTEGTVQRCILTSNIAARLISQMEDSLQLTKSGNVPKGLVPSRVSYVDSKSKVVSKFCRVGTLCLTTKKTCRACHQDTMLLKMLRKI